MTDRWSRYFGCQAWCARDGVLEINPFKPLKHFGGVPENKRPVGPLLTVVGEREHMLLVSPNMRMVTGFPKAKVRILSERPLD